MNTPWYMYKIKHAAAARAIAGDNDGNGNREQCNKTKPKTKSKTKFENNGKRESTACKNYIKIWILFVVATFPLFFLNAIFCSRACV